MSVEDVRYDREAAVDFLTARFPDLKRGERIEIRALDRRRGGAVVARDFLATPAEAADYAGTLDVGLEIYYGINPRLGHDGTKAGVSRVLTGWADLDFEKQERGEAVAALDAYELATSWRINSGNGIHAYWDIVPVDAATHGPVVERMLRALYARLGNPDRVQNIDRIFRLPGTFNNKYGAPRRVRVIERNHGARYDLAQLLASVPNLPPVGHTLTAAPTMQGVLSVDEVRELLRHIPPTLPYSDYLAVWMAVHALYPDDTGLQLVDAWSSEARAANGQYSSPRTQPRKHHEFRRSGETGAVGAGTLHYYAQRHGWTPPPKPVPLIVRKVREAGWRQDLAAQGEIDPATLPYWLGRQLDYLGETTRPFPLDWSVGAALTFGSIALAPIKFDTLGLQRWFLGVARSNSGKNVITDALYNVWKDVKLAGSGKVMTSGSPEGMWQALNGTGERLLAYHDEFESYLRSFQRDYMSTARGALCSLYDGRDVHHILARREIHAIDPYLVVVATTTPNGIARYMSLDDVQAGYVNRFGIVFADHADVLVEDRPSRAAAQSLADDLTRHFAGFRMITEARWDTPRGEVPALWRELYAALGVGTGKIYRVEDSVDEIQPAQWRLLARIKKDAAGLEAHERTPQISGHTLLVRESNLRLAIQIVLRGAAFARGMETIIAVGNDQRLMDRIRRVLAERGPLPKPTLRSLCHADIKPFDTALATMLDEGSIREVEPEEGKRAYRYKVG